MKQKNLNRRAVQRRSTPDPIRRPFIEHAYELRKRLYYIAIAVFIWGAAAYSVQEHIVSYLLRPSRGEHFIYTTPGGGIDFLFRICIYSGLVFSLPVIIYNVLKFIEPLISSSSQRFIIWGSIISGVLAVGGMAFGYYIGLPAALHFLSHQFTTVQIRPLVTIQSYLQFVIVYMVGSSLLFQLPLILVLINRIKPLKPRRLLHYERWVILFAFIISGLMNPTPNLISQFLIAGPFILMYQVGILLIWLINHQSKVEQLYQQDLAIQASRSVRLTKLKSIDFAPVPEPKSVLPTAVSNAPVKKSQVRSPNPNVRPAYYTNYVNHRPAFQDIRPVRRTPSITPIDRLPDSPV